MLRRLGVRTQSLAGLLLGGTVACGSAPPVGVGTDYIAPAVVNTPEQETAGADAGIDTPTTSTPDDFDSLLSPGWERGDVSPYCHSSFKACGGLLAGTWVVEDNCNPEVRTRDVLQTWGQSRLDLDQTACWNAVQRLTWSWSGELRFEEGVAIDNRQRAQSVYMGLTASCLNATLGMEMGDSVSPEVCDSMQNETTTCALAGGVCMCTNRTVTNGSASGVYGVLGLSVAIGDPGPTTRYEYCVDKTEDGERLLWREKEGALRQVVLRRTVEAPPGVTDPVEIPR